MEVILSRLCINWFEDQRGLLFSQKVSARKWSRRALNLDPPDSAAYLVPTWLYNFVQGAPEGGMENLKIKGLEFTCVNFVTGLGTF